MRSSRIIFPLCLAFGGAWAITPVARAAPVPSVHIEGHTITVATPVHTAPTAKAAQAGGRVVNVTIEAFNNPSEFAAVMISRQLVGGRFDYGPGMSVFASRKYSTGQPTQVLTDCAGLYNARVEQEYQTRITTGAIAPAKIPTYAVRRYGRAGIEWSDCPHTAVVAQAPDGSYQPVIDPRTLRQQIVVGPDLVTGKATEPLPAHKHSGNTVRRRIKAVLAGRSAVAHVWRTKRAQSRAAWKEALKTNPAAVDPCRSLPRTIPGAHLSSAGGSVASSTTLSYRTRGVGGSRHSRLKSIVMNAGWGFSFTWADGTVLSC
jgi:hypothetical protein